MWANDRLQFSDDQDERFLDGLVLSHRALVHGTLNILPYEWYNSYLHSLRFDGDYNIKNVMMERGFFGFEFSFEVF